MKKVILGLTALTAVVPAFAVETKGSFENVAAVRLAGLDDKTTILEKSTTFAKVADYNLEFVGTGLKIGGTLGTKGEAAADKQEVKLSEFLLLKSYKLGGFVEYTAPEEMGVTPTVKVDFDTAKNVNLMAKFAHKYLTVETNYKSELVYVPKSADVKLSSSQEYMEFKFDESAKYEYTVEGKEHKGEFVFNTKYTPVAELKLGNDIKYTVKNAKDNLSGKDKKIKVDPSITATTVLHNLEVKPNLEWNREFAKGLNNKLEASVKYVYDYNTVEHKNETSGNVDATNLVEKSTLTPEVKDTLSFKVSKVALDLGLAWKGEFGVTHATNGTATAELKDKYSLENTVTPSLKLSVTPVTDLDLYGKVEVPMVVTTVFGTTLDNKLKLNVKPELGLTYKVSAVTLGAKAYTDLHVLEETTLKKDNVLHLVKNANVGAELSVKYAW